MINNPTQSGVAITARTQGSPYGLRQWSCPALTAADGVPHAGSVSVRCQVSGWVEVVRSQPEPSGGVVGEQIAALDVAAGDGDRLPAAVPHSHFLGFIGGNYASGPYRPAPSTFA